MKIFLCSFLLVAALGRAEEAGDRTAIARTIAALNQDPLPAGVLAEGVDTSLLDQLAKGKLLKIRAAATVSDPFGATVVISHEPWGEARIGPGPAAIEMLNPRIAAGAVQFVTPEVALAGGVITYTGADGMDQSTPLLFVMKKDAEAWRIASIRLAGSLPAKN